MTSNRAFALPPVLPLSVLLLLSACNGVVPRTDERQPTHPAPAPAPPPLPPRSPVPFERIPERPLPPAAPVPDWRDVALPAGDWVWTMRTGGSEARFGPGGKAPVAIVQCDRAAGVVRIALPFNPALAPAPAPRPATITASTSFGAVSAEAYAIDGLTTLAIALPASSRLLDAMAFSRGRFKIDIAGLPPVVVPSWPEVGRVVEDCRG
jgi:hypothetical protein